MGRISKKLGIILVILYNWRKAWGLQATVVPATAREHEGWSATDKFTTVMETAGLNETELDACCRERGLFPEQVSRWHQTSKDAYQKPVLTM